MPDSGHPAPGRDHVALTLAVGVCTAFNLITIAVLVAAFYRGQKTGDYALSENATQVLIAGFGGFVGILGGYVGGRAVERAQRFEAASQAASSTSPTVGEADVVNIGRSPEDQPSDD